MSTHRGKSIEVTLTCVDCGYRGPFHDFSAKRIETVVMPAMRRDPPERYLREIGDVCTICFERCRSDEEE